MDLFFSITNIFIGTFMTLIGFKIYNPVKKKFDKEKEEEWYNKFGTFFKIGGLIMVVFGIIQTMSNLF